MTLIPPPLLPGDRIAVIAPAGNLADRSRYHRGCSILEDMGFKVANRGQQWSGAGYLADCDEGRLAEFHRAWVDREVRAIIALRGGFGALRLLGNLDVSVVRENPKLFVGFSDITLLHTVLFQQTGLITLHGPVLSTLGLSSRAALERFYQCLTGNWHAALPVRVEMVRSGPPAQGALVGGNLSSLVTLLGTPWEPDFSGRILLLEDVNEPLYRLDRLLTQLFLCGKFKDVAGIILGDFNSADDTDRTRCLRRHEFVWNRVSELTTANGMPVWGNFPAGHGRDNLTLPIGAGATMDSSSRSLIFSAP